MGCDRIRFGGTISGSTLSGGTLVESPALSLATWGGMMGHPGFVGQNVQIPGMDGAIRKPRKDYDQRRMSLTVEAWDRNASGMISAPGGRGEELDDNIDALLGLIDGAGGPFIIEKDQLDGTTRWIEVEVAGQAVMLRGPVFGARHASYSAVIPLVASYPMWQSETLNSDTLSGSDSLVNAGNGRISNAVLTFAGDGTLTNDDTGETLEVSGSSGAVVVDLGARSVTEGGSPAEGLVTVGDDRWMRFGAGTTSVTATVSVGVSYRDHWL